MIPDSGAGISMTTQLLGPDTVSGELSHFELTTSPPPAELGRALERNAQVADAVFRLRFGDLAAGLPISDLWSACCELLLEAELVREGKLDRFVLDVEQVFDVFRADDILLCRFSKEHVFAVSREDFASSLERVVSEIFAGTDSPQLMHIAARWGASSIRAQPYSYRFSDSVLM
jgi:hypothetical protein